MSLTRRHPSYSAARGCREARGRRILDRRDPYRQEPGKELLSETEATAAPSLDIELIQRKIRQESAFVARLLDEVGRVIVGQKTMVERLLIALLANGHVLMEGVPGPSQDPHSAHARTGDRYQVSATPVHTRPTACRSDRHARLRPEGSGVQDEEGPNFREHHLGR